MDPRTPDESPTGGVPASLPPPLSPPPPPRPVPLNFTGYCLGCSYNLRGLSEPRCPECGREFRPGAPSTYSLTPRGRPAALVQLVEAARGKNRQPVPWTVSRRVLWLEGRVRELSAQNAELESMLAALVDLLVARDVVRLDELAELMQASAAPARPPNPKADAGDEVAGPPPPAGDAPEVPLSEEPDLETAALRELLRAAQRRAAEGQQGVGP